MAKPLNPFSRVRSRPGRVSLLCGRLIHDAAKGWSHVRWFHLAAGAWKANQGFVAWDGEEPAGGGSAYFAAG